MDQSDYQIEFLSVALHDMTEIINGGIYFVASKDVKAVSGLLPAVLSADSHMNMSYFAVCQFVYGYWVQRSGDFGADSRTGIPFIDNIFMRNEESV